jgi:arylsulfate sulfotransferase
LLAVTSPLPPDFPQIAVYYADLSRMEGGFTLLDRFRRSGTVGNLYSIIVDNQGAVRWYSTLGSQDGTRQLPNGNLLLPDSSELDLLGNRTVHRTLASPGLLHHDLYPMDNGNFLSLALERVVVDDYPTSETDPSAPRLSQLITSDAVVEFAPDGSLLSSWHLTDLLDPRRIGYGSTKPGFPTFDAPDWSHSNAVVHDTRDDSIIVSIRHQDAVVKFSRATGALKWILGPHANWGPAFQPYLLTPVGTPFEWQFHQHAPKVTPRGTLLLMDNGNYRASPFDGSVPLLDAQNYSRAVEYEIDETNMQVRQVWEYGKEIPWPMYSGSQGDVDWMPQTGNVTLTLSDTSYIAGVSGDQWGLGLAHTAIVEVTHDSPAQRVFDMHVYDPDPNSKTWVYRSERIRSLYAADIGLFIDTDGDRILDNADNCTTVPNPDQRDTDTDGFGSACDPDLNNDNRVDDIDWFYFAQLFGTANANADFDGDGVVGWSDVLIIYHWFFSVPGPSGLHR